MTLGRGRSGRATVGLSNSTLFRLTRAWGAEEVQREVTYRPVEADRAARAGAMLAELV